MTPHTYHRSFRRYPCPGASLVEDHGHCSSIQGPEDVLGDQAGLHSSLVKTCIADQRCKLCRCEVGDGEKMARRKWRDGRNAVRLGYILTQAVAETASLTERSVAGIQAHQLSRFRRIAVADGSSEAAGHDCDEYALFGGRTGQSNRAEKMRKKYKEQRKEQAKKHQRMLKSFQSDQTTVRFLFVCGVMQFPQEATIVIVQNLKCVSINLLVSRLDRHRTIDPSSCLVACRQVAFPSTALPVYSIELHLPFSLDNDTLSAACLTMEGRILLRHADRLRAPIPYLLSLKGRFGPSTYLQNQHRFYYVAMKIYTELMLEDGPLSPRHKPASTKEPPPSRNPVFGGPRSSLSQL